MLILSLMLFLLIVYVLWIFFQVARYHHPSHKESYEIKIKRHFRKLKKILKKKVSLIAYYIICVP